LENSIKSKEYKSKKYPQKLNNIGAVLEIVKIVLTCEKVSEAEWAASSAVCAGQSADLRRGAREQRFLSGMRP